MFNTIHLRAAEYATIAAMFNSSKMMKMVDEVIRDHDLPCEPRRLFEPPDKSWTWCGEFADLDAPAADVTFEVCVQWPYGATYESVKADLARQLAAHFTRYAPSLAAGAAPHRSTHST